MTDASTQNPASGKLPTRLKFLYFFGAMAFGVKDVGFATFLTIYYNQVLGMDVSTVGLALMLALIIDALADPLIGNLSDRTYSRWGRRLPWLYAAPIPLAFAWVYLWAPPAGGAPSFTGLLASTVGVRLLLSAIEVPALALTPELTSDYDERTTLSRYRYLGSWVSGLAMMFLAYTVFMPGEGGKLRADGFFAFGITGAIVIVITVIGSSLGMHKLLAHLPAHKPPPFKLSHAFAEIKEAFSEKAFIIFALGALGGYVNQGLNFSMTNYLLLYVWQLSEGALKFYPFVLFLSALLMFLIVSPMHKKFGKPKSALIAAITAVTLFLIPYICQQNGFWPTLGTLPSTALYMGFLLFNNAFSITILISATSMIAEVVEAYQEKTGKRAEASFYSGNWLVQKFASGFGIFLTTLVLTSAGFPKGAVAGEIETSIITHVIILYAAVNIIMALWAAFWLSRFPISREEHEARVAYLRTKSLEE